jgi:hypothetical protein
VNAEIVKCIGEGGSVEFREPPCSRNSKMVEINSGSVFINKVDYIVPTKNKVGIDIFHGKAWEGITDDLEMFGYDMRLIESDINSAQLEGLDVLIIASADKVFTSNEVDEIKKFVSNGGGLLSAAQAWSWVYEKYGNKPIESFPLNILGKEMGFWITGNNIGAPHSFDKDILKGITRLKRTDWWPSEVELSSSESIAVVRDERLRIMGGTIPFGKGRILVYGHSGLVRENPLMLHKSLLYVTNQSGQKELIE